MACRTSWLTGIVSVTLIQLTVSQELAQPRCDFIAVARAHLAQRFSFVDLQGRTATISEMGNLTRVRFDLPWGHLGFVPVITIDKRSCEVVKTQVEQ